MDQSGKYQSHTEPGRSKRFVADNNCRGPPRGRQLGRCQLIDVLYEAHPLPVWLWCKWCFSTTLLLTFSVAGVLLVLALFTCLCLQILVYEYYTSIFSIWVIFVFAHVLIFCISLYFKEMIWIINSNNPFMV